VLSLSQAARTPTASDKARVERQLALALGASVATTATLAVEQAVASASTATLKPVAAFTWLHGWIAGAVLTAAITTGYLLLPTASNVPKPRAASTVARPVDNTPVSAPELEQAPTTSAPVPAVAAVPAVVARQAAHERAPHARTHVGTTLAVEIELLQRAQLAWREGAATRALALLAQHRRRFPHSQLGLERDALRILSLCQVGEQAQARSLARQLLARAPEAPMRTSIEQSCALK
jgi:hypothetical protein